MTVSIGLGRVTQNGPMDNSESSYGAYTNGRTEWQTEYGHYGETGLV